MSQVPTDDVQIEVVENNIVLLLQNNILQIEPAAKLKELQNLLALQPKNITFDAKALQNWDSSLLLLVYETVDMAKKYQVKSDISGLPQNLQELINLAYAVDRKPEHGQKEKFNWIERIGKNFLNIVSKINQVVGFIGDVVVGILRFFSWRSIMRKVDFLAALEDCGPKAIGIVSLISFLVGLILAFVGAVQLQMFGAQIYVASLVTIGMCRIMGAIMVGIIMAGRTGSAYAATIGTMQVNEELDALQTMGLSQIEFLVLPRMFALIIAMPILTMLADFMGMLGGAFVGVIIMNLPNSEYWRYALNAFNLNNFLVGIFHGLCFGFIIALCGCYCGLSCGRNADSVGLATTKSVVCAIVWMIVVTGIITVICQEIGV